MKEVFTYTTNESLNLNISFYKSKCSTASQTIIYLHGGGLIYGNRDDLPKEYIEQFLANGFHVITVDYPLAPESKLPTIIHYLRQSIDWFLTHYRDLLRISSQRYILFGRSAGAYLALLLTAKETLIQPDKLILFYGYHLLNTQAFTTPSQYYNQFKEVPKSVISRMITNKMLVDGPIQKRFLIYLYARQTGQWLDFLIDPSHQISEFELTEKDLQQLPETFIAQSKQDQDVPYSFAKTLNAHISKNRLYTLEYGEHDFDRIPHHHSAKTAYNQLIDWLTK
ncbi:alpha/beta hydrolase [Amphibacillus sp. Q70]|uniref:alpha/beta hydrolase n=1 Tax=Amphibacillus sp. Q70 TaxID=3453416 RepID=UPI003F866D48